MQPLPASPAPAPPIATPRRPSAAPLAALLGANAALSFGPWLVRLADVGPVAAAFWRLALAAPLLLLLTRVARQPIPAMPRRLWLGLGVGGLFFAADLGAWHVGILHTRLANATLFGNGASLFFTLYGFLIARTRPGRNQVTALLLAAAGLVPLLGRSYELSARNLLGDLLCLAAGLLYTGYLVAIDRARDRLPPLPALAIATLAGLAPLLAGAAGLGEPIWPRHWTPLLLLALGSQVVGQGLMVYAIGCLSPVIVGLGLLTQPAMAAAIGWLVYGERLTIADCAGAALIGAALVLVRRPDQPRAV